MEIKRNFDLKKLNTFGVSAKANFFFEIEKEEDVAELFSSQIFKENERLFLGGGSNILFTKDFPGVIVLNKINGIKIEKEDENNVWIRAYSGERWNTLVDFAVEKGYWGIENLALIPGTVGAVPVQNVGAYGVEIKDVVESVETYEIESVTKKIFSNAECSFGYRDSFFKKEGKGKYFIVSVVFKLNKKENKQILYSVLSDYLKKNNLEINSPKDISDVVSKIRKSKLPDPVVLGNAGSFFKNVFVSKEIAKELKNNFPEIPNFEEDGIVKIPAGWLIEQCGWKGRRVGNVGMHEHQALVLVNYGGATGLEIKEFSDKVISSIEEKFNIKLEREVNLI